ncbi:MAG: host-nuclease inhibitor Gam family protein [Planctomycetota bacterium]|jgi:phage host-nuclease inhibitor protein Gam
MTATEHMTQAETEDHGELAEAIEAFDLPELADTMEEAEARAAASRYLGAMRGVQAEHRANEDEYKALKAFQEKRHGERQGVLERQIDWLHEAVRTLFGFMTLPPKKKSLNLLGGRVGERAQQPELIIDDDEAVIAWAQETDATADLIKRTPSVDRKQLRTYMEQCKQDPALPAPPGVELKERPDQFYAAPATD